MKELGILEKAKAYDEALKEAIIAHKDEDRHLKATLERIFPVLSENEDERMMKKFLALIEKSCAAGGITAEEAKEMIAWLEKSTEWYEWYSEDEQNLNVCLSYIPDESLRKWLKNVIHGDN